MITSDLYPQPGQPAGQRLLGRAVVANSRLGMCELLRGAGLGGLCGRSQPFRQLAVAAGPRAANPPACSARESAHLELWAGLKLARAPIALEAHLRGHHDQASGAQHSHVCAYVHADVSSPARASYRPRPLQQTPASSLNQYSACMNLRTLV